ncbi:MAG: cytochrome c [Rhodospirillales bacterium]|nr:cytochrome c [Rhodospirillales bacterium]
MSDQRIETGAGLYSAMCAVCHGGPGLEKTELAQNPAAPALAKDDSLTPAQQFWTIKHGVKLTAMPA